MLPIMFLGKILVEGGSSVLINYKQAKWSLLRLGGCKEGELGCEDACCEAAAM